MSLMIRDLAEAARTPHEAPRWLGLTAQLDALGVRLAPVPDSAEITSLLDSVPLAVSFAEVRREPIEDLNEEPLELEPLEGDEGL
jgi:hypothetical protein